ncbi:MAG: hypothetical protein NC548_28385 [Lachnospiraceae bacterium]|nr:hypothetical protein [Lachnospiraceae bacterium]MCM1232008.1 hypothetical protein [Ruminococcus flavefaciens]
MKDKDFKKCIEGIRRLQKECKNALNRAIRTYDVIHLYMDIRKWKLLTPVRNLLESYILKSRQELIAYMEAIDAISVLYNGWIPQSEIEVYSEYKESILNAINIIDVYEDFIFNKED